MDAEQITFFSIRSCLVDIRSYLLDVRPYQFHVRLAYILSVDVHFVRWKVLIMIKTLKGIPTDEESVESLLASVLYGTPQFRFRFLSVVHPLEVW